MTFVRTLFLLRHAKSSWDDPALADHDRPLAKRGRRAGERMAEHLRSTGMRPALVLCSSAVRARETLDLVRPAFGSDSEVHIEDGLYAADASELLDRLHRVAGDVPSVMVIAHNPGLEDLAIELAGGGEPKAVAQLEQKFPTCALATLDLGAQRWDELDAGTAYLARVVIPRQLRT